MFTGDLECSVTDPFCTMKLQRGKRECYSERRWRWFQNNGERCGDLSGSLIWSDDFLMYLDALLTFVTWQIEV